MKKYMLPLILILALILGACARPTPEPTPEPTRAPEPTDTPEVLEPITLYHYGDLTNQYAALTQPMVNGFEDAIAYFNEQGGIAGHPIELVWADDQLDIELAIQIYEDFSSRDPKPVFIMTYGSPELDALKGRFAEDQIVTFALGLAEGGLYEDSGYAFGAAPTYPDQFALFIDWVTENWDDVKPANAGDDIVVAVITWPGAFGEGADTDKARAYAESKGVTVLERQIFAPTDTDVTTHLLTAQADGANVIYTNTLASGPATIAKGVVENGMQDDFLRYGVNWIFDPAFSALAGEAANGWYGALPYLWWTDSDEPGIQFLVEQHAANERGPAEMGIAYILTWSMADVAVQAIGQAIENVGFENLTGAAVHEALTTMGAITAIDGTLTVEFNAQRRSSNRSRIGQIQDGQIIAVTDWLTVPELWKK